MPRYVVHRHGRKHGDCHFDLMLERDALATFASGVPPDRSEALPCLVRQLPDHRLAFLEYEGELAAGQGWCNIHDRGSLVWIQPGDDEPIACANEIQIRLDGTKACGDYHLVREPTSGTDYWRLNKTAAR